jgi:hypothetical protein
MKLHISDLKVEVDVKSTSPESFNQNPVNLYSPESYGLFLIMFALALVSIRGSSS